ncbi:Beta-amylase 8 [Capsicum baccatum]|uniref:Beta-amylase 8 n=1 Tax=Capsicum baccatum TaxID=33114 RepID=A0A2G2XM70_CAPBA|nr:Beta-amylase 8 [Capsicum baccatum]
MAFHENRGIDIGGMFISLPQWVLEIGKDNQDIFFTDRQGRRNTECAYFDLMRSFRTEFDDLFIDGVISTVEIELGACEELNQPEIDFLDVFNDKDIDIDDEDNIDDDDDDDDKADWVSVLDDEEDDSIDCMDQPPAGFVIQGLLRPAFLKKNTTIPKQIFELKLNDVGMHQMEKVAEPESGFLQDSPSCPEELEKDETH